MKKLLILLVFIFINDIFLYKKLCPAPVIFDGHLKFYNTHTKETLDVNYLDDHGKVKTEAKDKINWILRSILDNKTIEIDSNLLFSLDQIQDHFDKIKTIEIICGYRSPYFNEQLRKHSNGVASNSLHKDGKAIDFRITGVSLKELDKYALSIKKGGVGFYSSSNFIHIDTGPYRKWGYRNYPKS